MISASTPGKTIALVTEDVVYEDLEAVITKCHVHFHLDPLRIYIKAAAFLIVGSTRLVNEKSHDSFVFLHAIGLNPVWG